MYVNAAEALWTAGITPRGMAHISGGGLLNIARLAANVSYVLDSLPDAPEIFGLIASAGDVDAATMYATFNMGIGFCVVVGEDELQAALDALKAAGEDATRIGTVTGEPGRTVAIPAAGLNGKGDTSARLSSRYVRCLWTSGITSRPAPPTSRERCATG